MNDFVGAIAGGGRVGSTLALGLVRANAEAQSLDAHDVARRPAGAAILDWTRARRHVIIWLLDSPSTTTYFLRRVGGELGVQP